MQEALDDSGLTPSSLVLEITESVMLADTELAVRRLQDLKALGVRLAMDDFGTGYSSLSYLGQFPVEILKMDRSFLASRDDDALAAAIIALGENLTLEVVAEGIEHPDQVNVARRIRAASSGRASTSPGRWPTSRSTSTSSSATASDRRLGAARIHAA